MEKYPTFRPIHPFPARMAPEIALEESSLLPPGSLVLDPMIGSGTVMRTASERGHRAIGFDMDPLAVLMAKVWTTPIEIKMLRETATRLIDDAKTLNASDVSLPWIDADKETRDYTDFWFAEEQQVDLRRLSSVLQNITGPIGDALKLALSRIIITKDRGASLARDVSHSRPHRVRIDNDFKVIEEFALSVKRLAKRLEDQPPPGNVNIYEGDARQLNRVATSSVDAVITSPPYLNAIDYLRGHRLTLVWLGYSAKNIRAIRSSSVGTELGLHATEDNMTNIIGQITNEKTVPRREESILKRYVVDMRNVLEEITRVLVPGGKAVLVVGNSTLRGVFIENSKLVSLLGVEYGLQLLAERSRLLPNNRRYLPPPTDGAGTLDGRMRTEVVVTLRKAC